MIASEVPSGWCHSTLGEVIGLQRGHDLPTQDRREGWVPIIGSFGITGSHDEARYRGPGVAIGRSGASIGVATYVRADYWPLNTCLFVRDFKGNDPRWVFYLLDSIDFSGFNSGSAQPSLNRNYLAGIPVLKPRVSEQRAVSEVLGALDNKIESNTRLGQTIADLLQVEFNSATADVETTPASNVLSLAIGSPFSGSQFSDPGVGRPLIRIRDLKTFEPQVWTTEHRNDEILVTSGDVLVGMDAEFSSTLWMADDAVLNQRVCRFSPRPGVARAFALLAIRPDLAFFEQAKSGTTVIHLNKADIENFTVPALSPEAHSSFRESTEPLVDRWVCAARESASLARLRDALAPELLSGRLRVVVTPELVEAAT